MSSTVVEVRVPDLGNISAAEIIEIAVKPGDRVELDESLLTLESDKASMDIPAPLAGIIKEVKVQVGDKLETGDLILLLKSEAMADQLAKTDCPSVPVTQAFGLANQASGPNQEQPMESSQSATIVTSQPNISYEVGHRDIYAGPTVRRMARELNIDLSQVSATGPKGRLLKEDVQAFTKRPLASSRVTANALPTSPIVNFSQFGEIETKPLSRVKKLTASHLHRNWLLIPHVTQFDEADITEMEAFRKAQQGSLEKQGIKLTPLAFIMKALVTALKAFPQFNASLAANGDALIIKKYFHIGVAVETADGLVVPVIRDVDKKPLLTLAQELATISSKARAKQLTANDMQGNSFTVSSLGGIGGTGFTPIVNLPDVAILGVSRASLKPVYQNGEFVPRLLLPLALSYDHRVIDGAEGARFIVYLTQCLTDIRYWLL